MCINRNFTSIPSVFHWISFDHSTSDIKSVDLKPIDTFQFWLFLYDCKLMHFHLFVSVSFFLISLTSKIGWRAKNETILIWATYDATLKKKNQNCKIMPKIVNLMHKNQMKKRSWMNILHKNELLCHFFPHSKLLFGLE